MRGGAARLLQRGTTRTLGIAGMIMGKVSVKGIVIGIIVTVVLDVLAGIGLMIALGGPPISEGMTQKEINEAINAFTHTVGVLAGSMVLGLLTTALGGYLAARIAKRGAYLNSGLLGVVGILIGMLFAKDLPLWFNALAFVLIIPAALVGGHLAKLKQGNA